MNFLTELDDNYNHIRTLEVSKNIVYVTNAFLGHLDFKVQLSNPFSLFRFSNSRHFVDVLKGPNLP